MAYDKKLGYDPDLDYTAEYVNATDPMMRESLAKGRAAKKAAMTSAGAYNTAWDTSWNNVYNANPISGMDGSGSFGAWGNTPIGQMGMGGKATPPTNGGASVSNAYASQYPAYIEPQASVNPYATLQKQAEQNFANIKQTQTSQVNQLYDNQAKQAYIQREQNTANMPKQLAAQGITGGMAESTAARIGTAYGNQLATNESARMGAVNDINIASAQQSMQMALDYADRMISQQNTDRNFGRGVYESDRGFNYQQGRDTVSDNQWRSAYDRGVLESDRGFARQLGRDAVSDNQWDTSFNRNIYEYDTNRNDSLTQQSKDNTYRGNAYNRGIYEFDTTFDADQTQQGVDNAYRDKSFNQGVYEYNTSRSDNLDQNAIDNAYKQNNSGTTTADGSFTMGKYATGIYDTFAKSEGKYDIVGALNKAYDSGLISAQDYAAALIQAGVDPNAKEKAAATAQATETNKSNAYTTIQNWTDNPANLGYGPLTQDKLQQLIDDGEVVGKYENGRFYYKRA